MKKLASQITGLGVYVPERKITNDDVLALLKGASVGYLSKSDLDRLLDKARDKLAKAGSVTRYWCRPDEYCPDIAYHAARRALDDAGLDAKDVDLIVFTGMSKAFVEPATAHVLRHELGAVNANVIDTQDACTSFMKSLDIADSFIKNGRYRTVLIASGERTYDWADFQCKTVEELAWKFGSLTIGDAAGALVVQATDEPRYTDNPRHMRFFYRLADGDYATCHIGLNYRVGERYHLHSHSSRLIRTGLQMVMELLAERLQEPKWQNFRFDNLLVHDVGQIIEDLVLPFLRDAQLCVPESYQSFFPKYGNVASTSLPLGMWLARERGALKKGNTAVFVCPAAGVQAGVMVFVY